jgi:hydrogenase expression/formation protein HypC
MCLAVPGKVIECRPDEAVVELQGNRMRVSTHLTPGAAIGDWLLIHAGFAIARLEEREALETWNYLSQAFDGEALAEFDAAPEA